MALAIAGMAKLLGQLTILIPATDSLVRGLSEAVSRVRQNPSADRRLQDLERAIELQVNVNKSLSEQLHIIQSVLAKVQRSFKVLVFLMTASIALAIVASLLAFWK